MEAALIVLVALLTYLPSQSQKRGKKQLINQNVCQRIDWFDFEK